MAVAVAAGVPLTGLSVDQHYHLFWPNLGLGLGLGFGLTFNLKQAQVSKSIQ